MADKSTPAPTVHTSTAHTPATFPEYPGQSLGITGLVFSFVLPLVGLVLGIIAWNWSKKSGVHNSPARAAVVVGAVIMAVGLIIYVAWIIAVGPSLFEAMQMRWGMRGF